MLHEQRVIAVAADYADALLVARRAKSLLVLALVLIVLAHLAIFFTAHFAPGILHKSADAVTTQPVRWNVQDFLHYLTAASLFGGIVFAVLLVLTLFLTIHIMLVGRLIGVRDVTRALTTSFLLLVLLVPWQTLLVTQGLSTTDVVWPGVLSTWREVSTRTAPAVVAGLDGPGQVIYWARFAALPIVGLILLLLIQIRSGRGLNYALREEAVVDDEFREND